MNRLWVRLTLAFLLVTLLMAAFVAVAITWSASRQFRGYLAQPGVFARGGALDVLEAHYEAYGSWAGVGDSLRAVRPRLRRGAFPKHRPPLLVTDAQGRIVYDEAGRQRIGQMLDPIALASAQPVVVSDAVVGYVLAGSPDFDPLGPLERRFLSDLQGSIALIALVGVGLGIVAGLFVSRSLSKPLTVVAQAAHAFAQRDWSQRVPLKATAHIAEVAEVAQAFNRMADSLQQAEAQRRNLMADVAHELRTPLTVIQGSLRALLDGVHPLQMKEIAAVYDETRLLARLVEDVRELALAEAHQLPMAIRPVDVGAALRATAERFAAAADAQQVALGVSISEGIPPAQADPDRLAQVLHNLVSNAFRHTPPGGQITLSAEALADGVRVSVRDTGEGIAEEDLPRVFDRFYRSDRSRSRSTGGAGLGLAIAKSLVENMGGRIGVESRLGQGSEFWFMLPALDHPKPSS
ncbi:MAG: sensor histidine kinase [Chloroflexi bacterium]|uniref:histidine kinase n=1 Tax=Candidatus Thermofonsia Clade 3 bacterium TaxID=2364212 RepID=A0A2M8QG72_9CHLR|nr:ATP-binding protein [Candidatus Roseilinea sp. NK_OTU-006]PJF48810.1 MAG: sensor histidine kinase [Candidatus Thermofonsia Clade 3 bacterium]RMG64828.1 MAG: sensor histidine kinase [Chloroflexota bacterium]